MIGGLLRACNGPVIDALGRISGGGWWSPPRGCINLENGKNKLILIRVMCKLFWNFNYGHTKLTIFEV